MAKSLDKVLQPDGTYKWELVEPNLSERMGNGSGSTAIVSQAETTTKTSTEK